MTTAAAWLSGGSLCGPCHRTTAPATSETVHAALRGAKRLEWTDATQIDFYDQAAQVTKALAVIDEHFRRTLGTD